MLKTLLKPTLVNAAGWAAALAFVGAWQWYENKSKLDAVADPNAYNKAILDKQRK